MLAPTPASTDRISTVSLNALPVGRILRCAAVAMVFSLAPGRGVFSLFGNMSHNIIHYASHTATKLKPALRLKILFTCWSAT